MIQILKNHWYELFAGVSIPSLLSNIPLGQDDCTDHVNNDRNVKRFLPTPQVN